MTHAQAAAFITAQTALFTAEMHGMLEENKWRTDCGNGIAYCDSEFSALIKSYPCLHHDNVIQLFRESTD